MDDDVRKMFYPRKGDVLYQLGIKRKIGTELGNGWVCIGNEKTEDRILACKLEYRGETIEPPNKYRV